MDIAWLLSIVCCGFAFFVGSVKQIVVVADSSAAQKVPAVDGIQEYRKDKQELYVRSNKARNVLAPENKIVQESYRQDELNSDKIKNIEQNLNKIMLESDRKDKLNSDRIKNVEQNLITLINQLNTALLPQRHECSAYTWLRESNRNQNYSGSDVRCDVIDLSPGWYRFGGEAGIQMPTSCVPKNRCGTHATGWMNGTHPIVVNSKVTRKVCYNWNGNCCQWSNNIEVVNCGLFYVYKLSTPFTCSLRYCGSDN